MHVLSSGHLKGLYGWQDSPSLNKLKNRKIIEGVIEEYRKWRRGNDEKEKYY
jgi:hypothetical protein